MARPSKRLTQNAPGDFYVDSSCIDCGTCWGVAPGLFASWPAGQAFVKEQPRGDEEETRATMALVSCPTGSIGCTRKVDAKRAIARLPDPIDGATKEGSEHLARSTLAPRSALREPCEVSYCGFAAESSFGASSYLIERPGANVLIDSPRAAEPLLERLAAKGGVRLLFLTHQDDVADHARLRERTGCERVLHEADVSRSTRDVERKLAGDDPVRLDADLLAIPVPGHTRGSAALLYKDRFLFTGDHLWGDGQGRLDAGRGVCWYSWNEQIRSMERLLDFRFEWVLPGHGERHHADSPAAMRAELEQLIERMKRAG